MELSSGRHPATAGLKKRRLQLIALLALLTLSVAACGSGAKNEAAKGATQTLTVRLALLAEGYDVATFYADTKGYFAEQGLKVDIKESTGSGTTTKLVGNGQADIGFADLPTAAKGIAQGVPIKAVGAVLESTPLATIYLEGKGINSTADLKGKTVADQPGAATAQFFPAFLKNVGLQESDLKSVNVDAAAREQLLLGGKIDAFNSYSVENVPVLDIRYKTKSNSINWKDHGLDMLGLGIVASNDTLSQKPDVVRKFLAAYAKGYTEAAAHPKEAAQAMLDHFRNAAGGSLETIEEQWRLSQGLQHTASTEGKPLLWMSPESWSNTLDINGKYSGVKTDKPMGEFYTNDLLPKVNKPAMPTG